MFLDIFDRAQRVQETSFAKFIRGASSGDKKRVYKEVLKKATDRQIRVIERVAREHGLKEKIAEK